MGNFRFKALEIISNRNSESKHQTLEMSSDTFASHVFDFKKMRNYLSEDICDKIEKSIAEGTVIEKDVANQVAAAMQNWATARNVTHYTHWFQPLTGRTAEKHDSFFEVNSKREVIEKFSGDTLIQQEPDASSFPSGGLRVTFEARGYTAWDSSSPAFIIEISGGKTLCIPTVFVSYTGESLDYKAPLLKALHALDKAAVDVCQFFDKNITRVTASLGIEQEYFLVDKALYNARPDLYLTGRTLFGHTSAKGQQLDDHYFGSIPERVYAYMLDLENEAWRLGIPLKTRHNEVAPSQYECAPIHEEINLAIDHNQLLMDLMDKVAKKHNLKALLHEKPYAGLNGSGKHNNWSIVSNTGKNLLSPGKTPKSNLMFLTFLINTIKAVHDHAPLLRASIASAGNDFRLGANEAPPAIISVFIGSQLNEVLDEIEHSKKAKDSTYENVLWLGIPKIPNLSKDNTDRNRTSPFAFTGNKFELRAVGSSANCAASMTVLNAIVANQLISFKHDLEKELKTGKKKDVAILEVLKGYIKKSKNVLFEGNGYSDNWGKQAQKLGLENIKTTPKALDSFVSKKSLELFERNNILTKNEALARHEVLLENYYKNVQIDARVIAELSSNMIIPVAIKYQNELIQNIKGLREIYGNKKDVTITAQFLLDEITNLVNTITFAVQKMLEKKQNIMESKDIREIAIGFDEKVKVYFEEIRTATDKLEQLVPNNMWELPKYRELLYMTL